MTIERVINNNIVSALDDKGHEVVIMGRGLGFKAKPGMEIPADKVEKIFRMASKNLSDQFKDLLEHMPIERVQVSNDIISYAETKLKYQLNQSIYVTLTDHINFAIERYKAGISFENAILWEVKQFYSQEYEVGVYAKDLIRQRLGIALPEDEAGFIALHLVNAEYGTNIAETVRFPNLLKDVLGIVKEDLLIELDESTIHYERFVTHLKFLIQRIYKKELLQDEEEELEEIMRRKYPREYDCSRRIAGYLKEQTGYAISDVEVMYMTIHIKRVTMAEN